ncbi:MAG: DUF6266 family protein [Bacteroidota bacterium]
MGIIRGGILGGFRKKTGAVIGAYWRSLDVIKGLPRKSNKPPTEDQMNQRIRFGLITGFLSWISPLIEVGYKALSGVETPMNVAVSYHLENAVTGVAPNFTIDYPKVMFSRGKLFLPDNIALATTEDAQLDISWTNLGPDDRFKDATDRLTVMVYNPAKSKFVTVRSVVARSAQSYDLMLPANFSGDNVHCYVSFSSVKIKNMVSESYYLGGTVVQ